MSADNEFILAAREVHEAHESIQRRVEQGLPRTTPEFEPISHSYYVDGKKVPSVTTIIRPLEQYYRMDQGLLRPYAERGTAVHTATEIWDTSQEIDATLAPENAGFLKAWVDFRRDFNFEPEAIEHRFYSELGYCGTIDRVGVMRGQLSIVDIKTSAKLGPAVGVQLVGYQHGYDPLGERGVSGRYAVQLLKDGTYRVEEYKGDLDWQVFLGLLALHEWQEKHRKTVTFGDQRPNVDTDSIVSNWPAFIATATRSI